VARAAGGAGCDTPQLYLGAPAAATDPTLPVKTLKKFLKVCADTQDVSFTIEDSDVSEWSVAAGAWALVPGKWAVYVGASSADIRLSGFINV